MESKVAQLANMLLKEGVELGELEKKKIVDAAKEQASMILSDAETKAQEIINEAQVLARELKKSGELELVRAADQTMRDCKLKITDLIVAETIEKSVTASLTDPKVMTELIVLALQNLIGDAESANLILPESMRETLESSLLVAIHTVLSQTITISFSKSLVGGFQIAPSGSSYKISLSEEDFTEYFKGKLRARIRTILFGE